MTTFTILFAISLIALIGRFIYNDKVKKSGYKVPEVFPEDWRFFLEQEVQFYAHLNTEEKLLFESDIQYFLGRIRITGVKTSVNDEDRLLVASSAVIPIFRFPEWEYKTLYEVLLYPDLFPTFTVVCTACPFTASTVKTIKPSFSSKVSPALTSRGSPRLSKRKRR